MFVNYYILINNPSIIVWIIIKHPVADLFVLNYFLAGRFKSSNETWYPNPYAKPRELVFHVLHFINGHFNLLHILGMGEK